MCLGTFWGIIKVCKWHSNDLICGQMKDESSIVYEATTLKSVFIDISPFWFSSISNSSLSYAFVWLINDLPLVCDVRDLWIQLKIAFVRAFSFSFQFIQSVDSRFLSVLPKIDKIS